MSLPASPTLVSICALVLVACGGNAENSSSGDPPPGDSDNQTSSSGGGRSTGGTEGSAGSSNNDDSGAGGSASDDVVDAQSPLASPLAITITNHGESDLYIPYSMGAVSALECLDPLGEIARLFWPGCASRCSDVIRSEPCGVYCEAPPPQLKTIAAGETVEIGEWDGLLHETFYDYCTDGGTCSYSRTGDAGSYDLTVTTFAAYDCDEDYGGCGDAAGDVITGAIGSGEPTSQRISLEFPPTDSTTLTFTFE